MDDSNDLLIPPILYPQPAFGAWAPVMEALGRDPRGPAAQAKRPA
ncbi:hypothetical protein [Burkholderia sp. Bp9031]|nr:MULTISPECIES: hypothetical protein [Burkholderia]